MKLFDDLLEEGIYACGTFRKDRRHIPNDIKHVKLGKQYMYMYNTKHSVWVGGVCMCMHV